MGNVMEESANSLLRDDQVAVVLLVYTQASVCETVQSALVNQPNVTMYCCHFSMDVIRMAERTNASAIIMEVSPPGKNELMLVQLCRATRTVKNIPFVLFSYENDLAYRVEAFKLGINDFLVGLPDPIELLARLRYHSRAYLAQLQRDDAYNALHEAQQRLAETKVELQRLSNADGLTGLASRHCADTYFTSEWKRAAREKRPLSLLVIDIDDFKRYNDVYGYLPGDKVIKQVASVLKETLQRPSDLTARFDGETLIAILPNTGLTGARYVAECIRQKVENLRIPHRASTVADYLTVSIGVASVIPQRGDSPDVLLEMATTTLRDAKQTGKNRVSATPSGLESSGAVNRLGDVLSTKQLKKIPKYLV